MGARAVRILGTVAVVGLAAVYFVPLLWMVMSTSKTNQEIFSDPLGLPGRVDLAVWGRAWRTGNLGRYALNSVIVTTTAVTTILLVGAAAAFGFSRFRFRGQRALLALFAVGLLMPLQSYFIAQSSWFDTLAIKDTRWALILPYAAMGLPLAVYLLKAYLDSLPAELFEAATIDGCGPLRTFLVIVLPLLRPGLATVGIFSAMNAWNEFLLALLYIQTDELKTIPTGLLAFSSRYLTDYQMLFSALSIVTIPMVAVYVMFSRQVTSGLTAGTLH